MAGQRFAKVLAKLKRRYGRWGRHYHTWGHIEALLGHCETVREHLHHPEVVELAIYWHDAVYSPLSRRNEINSAKLMKKRLHGLVQPSQLMHASCLIQATASHQLPSGAPKDVAADAAYFLDMDLSILGTSDAEYDIYEGQIRREYWMIPNRSFFKARAKILESFLGRDRLFFTDIFRCMWEEQARHNLARAVVAAKAKC
ncbi:MAG: hypothetical protein AAF986_09245 [Pseudomonadota bacterium]